MGVRQAPQPKRRVSAKWLRRAKPGSYLCKRCDRRVQVYVRAVVTCSRCGRAMSWEKDDDD